MLGTSTGTEKRSKDGAGASSAKGSLKDDASDEMVYRDSSTFLKVNL